MLTIARAIDGRTALQVDGIESVSEVERSVAGRRRVCLRCSVADRVAGAACGQRLCSQLALVDQAPQQRVQRAGLDQA
jgi:hypothetical protein